MRPTIWVLIALLGACGAAKEGDPCALEEDCASGLYCAAPNDPAVCGIPPREECAGASDCTDLACHAVFDSCSPDTVGSTCGETCETAGCSDGFDCGADGGCVPTSCVDDPSVCGSHQACDPSLVVQSGAPHAMNSGCVQVTCASDEDCEGACVDGLCHTGPGVCIPEQIVP